MVGVAGFEPATTRTPSECATSLRHTPTRRTLQSRGRQDHTRTRGDHSFFFAATRGRHCTNDRISTWNVHALFAWLIRCTISSHIAEGGTKCEGSTSGIASRTRGLSTAPSTSSAAACTPRCMNSYATDSAIARCATFEALYAEYCAGPLRDSDPSTKITVPALRSAILPMTACVQKNGPYAFTLSWKSKSSSVISVKRLRRYAPALLINTEIGPSSRSTVSTAATT